MLGMPHALGLILSLITAALAPVISAPAVAQDKVDRGIDWMIPGHGNTLTDIDLSADGTLWASASLDGTVKWGTIGDSHFQTVFLEASYPTAVRISGDQQYIAWGDSEGRVRVSGIHPDTEINHILEADGTPVQALHFLSSSGILLAGTSGPEFLQVSPLDGNSFSIPGPVHGVRDFQSSPDQTRLSILSRDGSAWLWDISEASNPTLLFIDPGPYTGALLTTDARWVFSTEDGIILSRSVYDPGAKPIVRESGCENIQGLWQDTSGTHFAALSGNGTLHRIGRPTESASVPNSGPFCDLAIHPSGRILAAHRNNGLSSLLEPAIDSGTPDPLPIIRVTGRIHGFSQSWISEQPCALSSEPRILSLDPGTGSIGTTLPLPSGWAGSIAWGKSLILANGQQNGWSPSVSPATWESVPDYGMDQVHLIVTSPSGSILAAAGGPDGSKISILSASFGLKHTIQLSHGPVSSMAFSADAKYLLIASTGDKATIHLHTLSNRSTLPVWSPSGPVRAIASHPHEARFAVAIAAPASPHVGLMDLSGFPRIHPSPKLLELPSTPLSLSYAPDGAHLIVGTTDSLLVFAGFQTVAAFMGEHTHASAIGFSADGTTTLMGRTDGSILGLQTSTLLQSRP